MREPHFGHAHGLSVHLHTRDHLAGACREPLAGAGAMRGAQ